jgi:hypothetical protein
MLSNLRQISQNNKEGIAYTFYDTNIFYEQNHFAYIARNFAFAEKAITLVNNIVTQEQAYEIPN